MVCDAWHADKIVLSPQNKTGTETIRMVQTLIGLCKTIRTSYNKRILLFFNTQLTMKTPQIQNRSVAF